MTKEEFASAWRMLRSILMAYLDYVKARIEEKTARALITPETFTFHKGEETPVWKTWMEVWHARQTAHDVLLQAVDELDCSDVGELLREDPGPYELDVDPDDERPAVLPIDDAIIDSQPKADNDGPQENPRLRSQSGQGYAARQAEGGKDTPGD